MALARDAGFEAARRAWQTPQENGDLQGIPGTYIEVRRRERVSVPEWAEEAEEKAGERLAIVAFRRSGEPWRAVIRLEELLKLLHSTGQTEGPDAPSKTQEPN